MLKAAFVVLAALSLGACASLGPFGVLDGSAIGPANAGVASEASGEPGERIIVADTTIETLEEARPSEIDAWRRRFGPPSERQPDLRLIVATAADRRHFYRGLRRRLRLHSSPPRPLLTS